MEAYVTVSKGTKYCGGILVNSILNHCFNNTKTEGVGDDVKWDATFQYNVDIKL